MKMYVPHLELSYLHSDAFNWLKQKDKKIHCTIAFLELISFPSMQERRTSKEISLKYDAGNFY
jgi:hypothetical protein